MDELIISPDGSQALIGGAWRTLSPDRLSYLDGSKWMPVSGMQAGTGTPAVTAHPPLPAGTQTSVITSKWSNPFVSGMAGCFGVGAAILLVLGLIAILSTNKSAPSAVLNTTPTASAIHWQHGSADVRGSVTGGDQGCTDMHINLVVRDKNDAIQHRYDLSVPNMGAHESKYWVTIVSGFTPEPITADITKIDATADCRDQH